MTWIAGLKLGGILALVAALFGSGYHFGGLASKTALEADHAAMSKAATDALLAQRSQAAAQAITDNKAETVHDQTLESLPTRVIRTPVFVRAPGDVCPDVVPTAQTQAGGQDPGGRGAEPGSRERDIRPAIEALKIKYERALADCRRLDAEWPQ
jgi:hypothetical protein